MSTIKNNTPATTPYSTVNGASKEAIAHHYDLSNEFYALWLDPSMTYTSALWADEPWQTTVPKMTTQNRQALLAQQADVEALTQAQARKLNFFAQHLQGGNGENKLNRVCDIGCGWGGALQHFLQHCGTEQAVGLTLSEKQQHWTQTHCDDSRLDIRLESWQDHQPEHAYDALISVEAIEAFVRPELSSEEKVAVYRDFFERCHQWLKPSGYFGLQAITYGNSRPEDLDDFIKTEIFPESDLAQSHELLQASAHLFEVIVLHNDRAGYILTLKAWLARLKQQREQAIALIGEKAVRRYQRYLQLCIYTFEHGACDLLRIIYRRIDQPCSKTKTKY